MNKIQPSAGNFCKKVFYRNIASAIGIVCVDYFSFSGIFIDMFVIFSRIMLTKVFLSYMFKHIGMSVLHKIKKAPTKFQTAIFILHCQYNQNLNLLVLPF